MNLTISDAISASIDFEALMESTDFNSYLPNDKKIARIKESDKYHTYKKNLGLARRCCKNVVEKRPDAKNAFTSSQSYDEFDITQRLIFHLFEAKKKRLKAREQITREEEKKKYIDAAHQLNKIFYDIPEKKFYGSQKGKDLKENFNWAKVLFYNELAICYSGLEDSSISLGYAERSKILLKEIYPEIDSHDGYLSPEVKLYTFALYNKGEAERLLDNYDLSLKTFNEIIDIYNKAKGKKTKPSDYSDYLSALLRTALILTDQGRGSEALACLNDKAFEDKANLKDYRLQERYLEKASALIDQKEYIRENGACKILSSYLTDEWENTFTQRKAKNYELRLLIEFKKNKLKDFNESAIKSKYEEFEKIAKGLLIECVSRYDGDIFKKTCINLADYFHEKEEKEKENELKCYYLYLFNEWIFKQNDKCEEIINNWTSQRTLKDLIKQYHLAGFSENFIGVNDERYLKGFFETYMENCKEVKPDVYEENVIEKLKIRLVSVYNEKDNRFGLGEVEDKFNSYKDESKTNRVKNNKSVKFIEKYFFKAEPSIKRVKQISYLSPESILAKMHHNTYNFAKKVVGNSKLVYSKKQFNGIMTVLRRWNSFTPTLASTVNPSKGGGYFFYFQQNGESIGLVVDPGYDFLENFFSQGFRIGDIDAIIVTHAHPDHTDNFPSILSLFHELNHRLGKYYKEQLAERKFQTDTQKSQLEKKTSNKKHLKLILSQGVFDQYYKLMKPSEESFKDIVVVQANRDKDIAKSCYKKEFGNNFLINIEAFATSHKDLSQWESLGFVIKIEDNNIINRQIGYTSDAHWNSEFSKRFKDCQIVIAHLGSIVDIFKDKGFCTLCSNFNKKDDKCKNNHDTCEETEFRDGKPDSNKLLEQAKGQSHLYLSGLTMFFDDLLEYKNLELAIISEFGEELKGGIRMDLFHKFDDWYQQRSGGKARCIPGDIGTEIDLMNSNIFCCCCGKYKQKNRISPIAYGKEEAIFFVCDECNSVLSTHQIDKRLKDYYENGRKLELADESK